MNERIKELLKQASKLANTDDNKDFDRNFDMIVAEKFAELIVKECVDVANSKAEGIDLGSMLYLYTEDIEDTIKKHFGVEE